MATTGRPPKSIEQKRRAGNPGKRPLPAPSKTIALRGADTVPPVPMTLKDSGRARWVEIWTGPAKAWLARDVDCIRVSTVCHLTDDIATYRKLLAALGPIIEETIVTPTGVVTDQTRIVPNPLVKMLRDAEKNLDRELTTLAFDPVSRSRLGLAEVKRQSVLEQLLAGDTSADDDAEIIDAEVIEIAADD